MTMQAKYDMASKETGLLNVKFGQEARDLLYAFDKRTTFVNHGSYGVAPQQLLKKRLDLIKQQESSPDQWFRFTSPQLAEKNIDALAKFLKVDTQQLTLCVNATDALNTVIKSINYREDNIEEEVILASRYTYNAILNTLHYTANYRATDLVYNHFGPVKIFQAPCVYPISSADQILDVYDKMCQYLIQEKHYRIKLVVLDHISSESATLYPVKEIIQIIRKWSQKTPIVIDGAHAIGQVEIQLKEIDCDFYVSNLHKWFLIPRGCAFLYSRDTTRADQSLQPNYISHGYLKPWSVNSRFRGTVDLGQFYLVDDAIRFFTSYLGDYAKILDYNSSLVGQAAEMLAQAWNTHKLRVPRELEAPYMRLIRMPDLKSFPIPHISVDASGKTPLSEETIFERHKAENACFEVVKALTDKYNVDSFVSLIQGSFYVRISCYIYNEMSDYEALRDAVLALANE